MLVSLAKLRVITHHLAAVSYCPALVVGKEALLSEVFSALVTNRQ